MTGNGDTELSTLSAELVALTLRDHSALEAQLRAASSRMRRVSGPNRRWFSRLLGSALGEPEQSDLDTLDRELNDIAKRIEQLGEDARGRAIVLRRLSEKAAKASTNTYITGMNATFIKAAAAKAAVAEDTAADAAERFLTQALPLWRTTRAHGNRQMRNAANAVEAALDTLGASIEQSRAASSIDSASGAR